MRILVFQVLCAVVFCSGQNTKPPPTKLHNGLTDKIGNFSIELLYHTTKSMERGQNLIISPITVWTVLAVISEGASSETLSQLNRALRLTTKYRNVTRSEFRDIASWLLVNTDTIELARINAMFIDENKLPELDFQTTAKDHYATRFIPVKFSDGQKTADAINTAISNVTRGRIPKLVDSSYFGETQMILTSAVYFKGQWTVPFNATQTSRLPFYNHNGQRIGEVNMMYNRYTYPFANIRELQARIMEIPYGKENRLSMLIMLPYPNVTLQDMFLNFGRVPLDTVFSELRLAREEYSEDEVDCLIPRFKIESNLELTDTLRKNFGIEDLFDQSRARLPRIARTPLYVTKVIHKAEIEVTEEGTVASGVTAAEFSNRIGTVRFEANRPFTYMIVEKVTNSIVFGGIYDTPSLY